MTRVHARSSPPRPPPSRARPPFAPQVAWPLGGLLLRWQHESNESHMEQAKAWGCPNKTNKTYNKIINECKEAS